MTSEPSRVDPGPEDRAVPDHGVAGGVRSVFNDGDLALLLSEFERVRSADEADGQLAGEALTLAATAVRIVEAELGRAGAHGLSAAELATAREVLRAALAAVNVALSRMDSGVPKPARARGGWLRRRTTPDAG